MCLASPPSPPEETRRTSSFHKNTQPELNVSCRFPQPQHVVSVWMPGGPTEHKVPLKQSRSSCNRFTLGNMSIFKCRGVKISFTRHPATRVRCSRHSDVPLLQEAPM